MGFYESLNKYGRQIKASLKIGGVPYTADQIISINPNFEGKMLSTVMRGMNLEIGGVKSVSGMVTDIQFGVKAPGETDYQYHSFEDYIITEQEIDEDTNSLKIKCYDKMIQSMIPYDLQLAYPTTLGNLFSAICSRLGWEIGTENFANCATEIDEEKFDSTYTFRDVLDQIAQCAAGAIAIKNGKCCVLYPTDTGITVTKDNLKDTLNIGEKWGPINSVVLVRAPQEDNIYRRNEESIAENGLTEFRIENNQILDTNRDAFVDAIFNQLQGLTLYPFEFDSFGVVILDVCDIFTINTGAEQYPALFLNHDLKITSGTTENVHFERPEQAKTDYTAASKTDKALKMVNLRVDKQDAAITAVAEESSEAIQKAANAEMRADQISTQIIQQMQDIDGVKTRLSEVQQAADGVSIRVRSIEDNGVSQVKNELGVSVDGEGLHVDKSGEELSSSLTHNGLYVDRGADNVLTANASGVNTENLTVRTYLVAGVHTRIEEYTDPDFGPGTAAFYLR